MNDSERPGDEQERERRQEEEIREVAAESSIEEEVLGALELSTEDDEGRLRRVTAIAIVVVSILAATMVWRASVADESSAEKTQSAQQNLILAQQLTSSDESAIFYELNLFGRYEQHVNLAVALEHDSHLAGPAGGSLLVQAQSERGLARDEQPLFQRYLPPARHDGTVSYDAAYARRAQQQSDQEIMNLRSPEELDRQATAEHGRGVRLTGLAALFVAALVFLTLSELTRRGLSRFFAATGAAVAGVALILFLLV